MSGRKAMVLVGLAAVATFGGTGTYLMLRQPAVPSLDWSDAPPGTEREFEQLFTALPEPYQETVRLIKDARMAAFYTRYAYVFGRVLGTVDSTTSFNPRELDVLLNELDGYGMSEAYVADDNEASAADYRAVCALRALTLAWIHQPLTHGLRTELEGAARRTASSNDPIVRAYSATLLWFMAVAPPGSVGDSDLMKLYDDLTSNEYVRQLTDRLKKSAEEF